MYIESRDFTHDWTVQSNPLKLFAITDVYNCECLALNVARCAKAACVVESVPYSFLAQTVPRPIRVKGFMVLPRRWVVEQKIGLAGSLPATQQRLGTQSRDQ